MSFQRSLDRFVRTTPSQYKTVTRSSAHTTLIEEDTIDHVDSDPTSVVPRDELLPFVNNAGLVQRHPFDAKKTVIPKGLPLLSFENQFAIAFRCPQLKSRHIMIMCTSTVTDFEGAIGYCSFECRKGEALTKFVNHEHEYKLRRDVEALAVSDLIRSDQRLISLFVLFAIDANISFTKTASSAFTLFIEELVNRARTNPEAKADEIFPVVSRKKFKKQMMATAENQLEKLFERLDGEHVSIALDAGTIKGIHIVLMMLLHVDDSPTFYKCVGSTDGSPGFNTNFYRKVCEEAITELADHNITVDAFVSDGLCAQTNAIDGIHRDSIQKSPLAPPEVKKTLYVPCICHSINLVTEYWFKTDCEFMKRINSIKPVVTKLRSQFTPLCPPIITTRWLYLLDVLTFITKHKTAILEKVELDIDQRHTVQDVDTLMSVIHPMVRLILEFEKDTSRLSEVVPQVEASINDYTRLTTEFIENKDLAAAQFTWKAALHLHHFLIDDRHSDLYALSYIPTLAGRISLEGRKPTSLEKEILAKQMRLKSVIEIEPKPARVFETPSPVEEEQPESIIVRETFGEYELIDKEEMVKDRKLWQAVTLQPTKDVASVATPEKIKELKLKRTEKLKDLAFNEHDTVFKIVYGNSDPPMDIVGSAYHMCEWTKRSLSKVKLAKHLNYGDVAFWNYMNSSHGEFHLFSKFALLLMALPASEASCERYFSKCRQIVGDRRGNLNIDTLGSLLRLTDAVDRGIDL